MRGFKMFTEWNEIIRFCLLFRCWWLWCWQAMCAMMVFIPFFLPSIFKYSRTHTRIILFRQTYAQTPMIILFIVRFSFENNFPTEDFEDSIIRSGKIMLIKRENKNNKKYSLILSFFCHAKYPPTSKYI